MMVSMGGGSCTQVQSGRPAVESTFHPVSCTLAQHSFGACWSPIFKLSGSEAWIPLLIHIRRLVQRIEKAAERNQTSIAMPTTCRVRCAFQRALCGQKQR